VKPRAGRKRPVISAGAAAGRRGGKECLPCLTAKTVRFPDTMFESFQDWGLNAMLSEQLLGYDAREMWLNYTEQWPADRRAGYLLKQDLTKPLSIDRGVWQSVMETMFPFAELLIQYRNGWYDLWYALPLMQAHFAAIWTVDVQPYWMIAVTIVEEEQQEEHLNQDTLVNPNKIDRRWNFLGYDVADIRFRSALSNAYYYSDEVQSLRDKWAAKLNGYHLFEDMEDAIEFAEWSDLRDTGHAPNEVFGLYLIPADFKV
jgi:hypothetical protein